MTKLLLVRHGETDSNRDGRLMGQSNIPMNLAGRRQVERLAARLHRSRVDVLYSSDLDRALETARIVGAAIGLDPLPLAALRELDVGTAAGTTRDELIPVCPDLFGEAWIDTPFPGGESYAQMTERVGRALRTVLVRHEGQTIIAVTHGGTIRAAVAALTGIPLGRLIHQPVANASITWLSAEQGGPPRLEVLNDVAHLAVPEPVTGCDTGTRVN